jgi:hypothetical protein
MKLNAILSKLNENGCAAIIETDDGDYLHIAANRTYPATGPVCKKAASKLRELANRFDKLASEPEPYKEATHTRINK